MSDIKNIIKNLEDVPTSSKEDQTAIDDALTALHEYQLLITNMKKIGLVKV